MHLMHRIGELEPGALQLVSEGETPTTFSFIVPEGPLI